MTFDPATLTGQKPVAALIDELHVVSKMSKAASALRQLRGGMLPYPEAFMAFITTQSEEARRQADQCRLLQNASEADVQFMGERVVAESAPVGLESERIGQNEYVVSRSFMERLMHTREPEGRAVAHEQSGIAFGVRIYGLRRRGEFEQLGFRNGDVVLRMNGISVSTPNALPEVATALESSNAFAFDVLRAGRVMTLRYTVLG